MDLTSELSYILETTVDKGAGYAVEAMDAAWRAHEEAQQIYTLINREIKIMSIYRSDVLSIFSFVNST